MRGFAVEFLLDAGAFACFALCFLRALLLQPLHFLVVVVRGFLLGLQCVYLAIGGSLLDVELQRLDLVLRLRPAFLEVL